MPGEWRKRWTVQKKPLQHACVSIAITVCACIALHTEAAYVVREHRTRTHSGIDMLAQISPQEHKSTHARTCARTHTDNARTDARRSRRVQVLAIAANRAARRDSIFRARARLTHNHTCLRQARHLAIFALKTKRPDSQLFWPHTSPQHKHLLLVHAMGVAPTAHHPPCSDDVSGRVLEDSQHRLT